MSKFANFFQALRTGAGSAGGSGATGTAWTVTADEGPGPGGIDCAGALRVQGAVTFFNASPTVSISGATSNFVTTTGNANQQVAKGRIFNESLTPLALSSTILFPVLGARAGTVTQVSVAAVTKPTATSSITIQIFKNSTANPVTAIYDFNSVTSGAVSTIPITGNQNLLSTDFIFAQVITGASLNSANGLGFSAEVLTTPDY